MTSLTAINNLPDAILQAMTFFFFFFFFFFRNLIIFNGLITEVGIVLYN